MAVSLSRSAFTVDGGEDVAFGQIFALSAGTSNPTYLVLSGLDRDEYTAAATHATGTLSGNGATDAFTSAGGDFRTVGIVFTYNAATGQYLNATYGALSQLQYQASASADDLVNFAVYGFSSLTLANTYATNPTALMQLAAGGQARYAGSASFATLPGVAGTTPTAATPNSIAAAAESFVGQAWNLDGCWVLASTVATEAGAGLPVTSTEIGVPALASGEWFAAYDGPVAASSNWEALLRTGEVVSFETGSGGGHIVTIVSGSGSTAMIVDNVEYVSNTGQPANPANDGSDDDIAIAAAHPFAAELRGVPADSVVIYELDTPSVTADTHAGALFNGATVALSTLFTASDPKNTAIAEEQAYETNAADAFTVAGLTTAPTSAATAVTAGSLSAITFDTAAAGTDTIEVRAFNGSYWGDWTALSVTVATATAAPPLLAAQTAAQTWLTGRPVSLSLAGVFTAPGQTLTLSVTQANGAALPSGLTFNAGTDLLSGTAPITPEVLGIKVTATGSGGLATSELFAATVVTAPAGPVLARQTAAQVWQAGGAVSFTLPQGTFADAVQEQLHYAAYQTSGSYAAGWLRFNPATQTLSGTVPNRYTGQLGLEVVVRNAAGQSATDAFTVQITGGTAVDPLRGPITHMLPGIRA